MSQAFLKLFFIKNVVRGHNLLTYAKKALFRLQTIVISGLLSKGYMIILGERKAIFDVYCENEEGEKFIVGNAVIVLFHIHSPESLARWAVSVSCLC